MQKILTTVLIILFSSAIHADNGDIIFTNTNHSQLGINDSIQFQLITNDNGLVTSAVLKADDSETLTHWRFSDTTESFVVYIRDASKKQMNYTRCSSMMSYQKTRLPIQVEGWSDGHREGCLVS